MGQNGTFSGFSEITDTKSTPSPIFRNVVDIDVLHIFVFASNLENGFLMMKIKSESYKL